jgi:tetratricopeptide (TPR) repeat protein
LERFELAIKDYSNELKFGAIDQKTGKSTNIKAYNNRAYCLAKLGNYQEAIVDYTNVIQQDK